MIISEDIISILVSSKTISLRVLLERNDVSFVSALGELEYLVKNNVIKETDDELFTVTDDKQIINSIRKESGYWYYPHKAKDFKENWGTVFCGSATELLSMADTAGGLSEAELIKSGCPVNITEALIDSGLLVKFENKYYSTISSENITRIADECRRKTSKNRYGYSAKDKHTDMMIFGSYPQSRVKDAATVNMLNSIAKTLPDKNGNNGWVSFKSILECSASSKGDDFMWYKDIEFKGIKYRGVYFTIYKANSANHVMDDEDAIQLANGYHKNTVYWFVFEPVEWNILKEDEDRRFILSRKILDAQPFQKLVRHEEPMTFNNREGAPESTLANDWMHSDIRLWLNDSFICTAFSDEELEQLERVPVYTEKSSENTEITEDKIFLPSREDVTSKAMGYASEDKTKDIKRQPEGTDYARAMGIGCNDWWLRSPVEIAKGLFVYYVRDGAVSKMLVSISNVGVVPVAVIRRKRNDK